MIISFISTFFRIVIGLVFLLSFAGKVRGVTSFQQTVIQFKLFPASWSRLIAIVFLGSELAVALAMLAGGKFLAWGYLAGGLLLVAFSAALVSVLVRKIDTSCNCFGSSKERVSSYDIVRNAGFLLCALGGYLTLTIRKENMAVLAYGLAFVAAVVFVIIWINLKPLISLF